MYFASGIRKGSIAIFLPLLMAKVNTRVIQLGYRMVALCKILNFESDIGIYGAAEPLHQSPIGPAIL